MTRVAPERFVLRNRAAESLWAGQLHLRPKHALALSGHTDLVVYTLWAGGRKWNNFLPRPLELQ